MRHLLKQQGQATVELMVMIVGLVAMILGVMFICGLTLGSNQRLLNAKGTAELKARYDLADGDLLESPQEVLSWNHGVLDLGNKKYRIPFSPSSSPVYTANNSLDHISGYFSNSQDSAGTTYSFRWNAPNTYSANFMPDFTTETTNAFNAAQLVAASSSSSGPTLNDFLEGSQKNAADAMRKTFYYWFGVRVDEEMLNSDPTNRVYMPVTEMP